MEINLHEQFKKVKNLETDLLKAKQDLVIGSINELFKSIPELISISYVYLESDTPYWVFEIENKEAFFGEEENLSIKDIDFIEHELVSILSDGTYGLINSLSLDTASNNSIAANAFKSHLDYTDSMAQFKYLRGSKKFEDYKYELPQE